MKIKSQIWTLIFISMVIAAPTAVSQTPATEKSKIESKVTEKAGTLTAIIEDSVTFSTLTKALKITELDVTLEAKGEFTVFAPTDDAFGKLPDGVLAKLMLPENKEKLRTLLLYHVVAGRVIASDLKEGHIKTMNGEKVKISMKSDSVEVDGSKIFSSDVMANNGVMHSIGEVIIPETLKEFVTALTK